MRILFSAIFLIILSMICYGDASDIAALYSDCIVVVETSMSNGGSIGSGSLVSSDGYIITNAHAVDGENLRVTLKNKTMYPADLISYDIEKDIAIIKINVTGLPSITFGSSSDLKSGQDIVVIGAPKGLDQTVTKGIISNLDREHRGNNYIQIDAAVNSGNSGGPVFNMDGAMVGMVTLKDRSSDGIAFAIPSDVLMSFLNNSNVNYSTKLGTQKNNEKVSSEKKDEKPKPIKKPEKKKKLPKLYIYAICIGSFILLSIIITIIIMAIKKKRRVFASQSNIPSNDNFAQEDLSDLNIILSDKQQIGTSRVSHSESENLDDIDIELK